MAISRYMIEIFYSDEDEGFIAAVPELPGCSAFGEIDDALVEIKTAITLRLETARPRDTRFPGRPKGRSLVREIDVLSRSSSRLGPGSLKIIPIQFER